VCERSESCASAASRARTGATGVNPNTHHSNRVQSAESWVNPTHTAATESRAQRAGQPNTHRSDRVQSAASSRVNPNIRQRPSPERSERSQPNTHRNLPQSHRCPRPTGRAGSGRASTAEHDDHVGPQLSRWHHPTGCHGCAPIAAARGVRVVSRPRCVQVSTTQESWDSR